MPWKAIGKNIVRADTGKVVGKSKDHATAMASVRARYANSPEFNGGKKKPTVYHACGKKCDGGKMMSK